MLGHRVGRRRAPTQYVADPAADAAGWFTYLDDPDPSGTGWRRVVGNLLYPWQSKPRTGLWEIELRAKDAVGTEYAAQVITCPDTTTRQRVRLYLDQADPSPTSRSRATGCRASRRSRRARA